MFFFFLDFGFWILDFGISYKNNNRIPKAMEFNFIFFHFSLFVYILHMTYIRK